MMAVFSQRLAEAEQRADDSEAAQLANIPPDTAHIIKELKAKLVGCNLILNYENILKYQ
jgi:hypothetical protein